LVKKKPNIQFSFHIDIKNDFISYEYYLFVILENPVENFINFSIKGNPMLMINIFEKEDLLFLEVIDNGQGVSSEYKEKVFEMYFKANEMSILKEMDLDCM
jgi:K+-sensing histidine kinase KdpD